MLIFRRDDFGSRVLTFLVSSNLENSNFIRRDRYDGHNDPSFL